MGDITQLADSSGDKFNPAKEDGNLATIKDDLALIKADIDDIRVALQIMDDWDTSDKAKTVHENHPNHWQIMLSASGDAKTEATGKIVVITDIMFKMGAAAGNLRVRQGGSAGTIICTWRILANTTIAMSFREGLEGAAHDGSGAGDIYCDLTGTDPVATITGYMRDA